MATEVDTAIKGELQKLFEDSGKYKDWWGTEKLSFSNESESAKF